MSKKFIHICECVGEGKICDKEVDYCNRLYELDKLLCK